jgi:hypothetical protein
MRPRKIKNIDGKTYERVDTSRFFQVKARTLKNALRKLESIHRIEVKEMFSSLTVSNLLADKREARFLTTRETQLASVAYPVTMSVPTDTKYTETNGFNYPKFTPCGFVERLQMVTEMLPVVQWID